MKPNYLLIPLFVFFTAFVGGRLTSSSVQGWYQTINKSSWTPPGSVIGIVWTILFILIAISMLIVWNKMPPGSRINWLAAIFAVNLILNVGWSWLFFGQHLIGWAVLECALLDTTIIALIVLIWPASALAASLLIPYAVWVAFATFLTYKVWTLN